MSATGEIMTGAAASATGREPALAGQTVVVIGGSAGIGLETARRARAEGAEVVLAARGAEVSEVFHPGAPGAQFEADAGERVDGPADDGASYSSFATFHDPDGNTWLLQEVTTRLPGRTDPAETTFSSAADLAGAMRRASAAHGEHEKRTGEADANWPDWYAAYMVAEQAGTELPL